MSEIDDRIHRIVSDKLEDHRREVDRKLDKVISDSDTNRDILHEQNVQLTKIDGKLEAIYGNGSGRPGKLEEMDNQTRKLQDSLAAESKKQSDFRHEIRGMFETFQLQHSAEKERQVEEAQERDAKHAEEVKKREINYKHNKDRLFWIRWIAGGIAFVGWELIKIYVLKKG